MVEGLANDGLSVKSARNHASLLHRLAPSVLLYWLVAVIVALALTLPNAKDLIGPDNDDAMRLVEVRDFLNGQGWFDLMQYRLGIAPGTLMHWSRFIDLPISLLIRFFSLFFDSRDMAEGAAAVAWPLLLVGPLLWPLALAARWIGGIATMHIALGFGVLFVVTCAKFKPGAIDHHNVQMVLTLWVVAMLVDPRARAWSHAVAGLAAALAIAIGAETVPFVAVACICVVIRWVWQGADFASAGRAFGLTLALSIAAAFFVTVPPSAYSAVTCDNLSLGFFSLTAIGGAGFFIIACLPASIGRLGRLLSTAGLGIVVLATAKLVAPQCLGDPLGNLDPLLVTMWLNGVSEARPAWKEIVVAPETFGGYYIVGFFALAVCASRMWMRRDAGLHLLLFMLVAAEWGVSLIQVRNSFFASLLSILPLSLLIADLRKVSGRDPENPSIAAAYILTVLASVPVVWGVAGVLVKEGVGKLDITVLGTAGGAQDVVCGGPAMMKALNELPAGTVLAPSNSGAGILRYTGQRVLTGPYHRNQAGMLAELHAGMARPEDAVATIRQSGATILAFCNSDPQTESIIRLKPESLYAALNKGNVPGYLEPVGGVVDGFRIFKVIPPAP
jgi:hypothetical protein